VFRGEGKPLVGGMYACTDSGDRVEWGGMGSEELVVRGEEYVEGDGGRKKRNRMTRQKKE
jgi:hypothetical protein